MRAADVLREQILKTLCHEDRMVVDAAIEAIDVAALAAVLIIQRRDYEQVRQMGRNLGASLQKLGEVITLAGNEDLTNAMLNDRLQEALAGLF